MRVHVNLELCQSHGMCVYAAPDVFRLDDDDLLHYAEEVDESRRAEVEDAVKVCPARAISIPED
jgi:ferredoxin